MKYQVLGRTGLNVWEISFGAWAICGSWGEVDDKDSLASLHKALDLGVNFIDTADVYGMGRSERLIGLTGKFRRDSHFDKEDHRNFNRHGQAFDVGETFSGTDYDVALDAEDIRKLAPNGTNMTQFALRWISMFHAVEAVYTKKMAPLVHQRWQTDDD